MLLEHTHASIGSIPIALAVVGAGMTVGSLVGGRLADHDVRLATRVGFVATAVSVAAVGLVMVNLAAVFVALFFLGATSQVLGIGMQTSLMDLSPRAPSLGASLCHSSLNLGNADGAFLGGAVISMGLGYPALAWTGVVLTVVGLGAMLLVQRRTPPRAIPEEFRQPA